MKQVISILLVEDVPKYARMLRDMLHAAPKASFQIDWVESVEAALQRLGQGGIDIILLDLSLTGGQGLEVFGRLQAAAPLLPIIVLSSFDDENLAITAMHDGAQDYLVKGEVDSHLLVRSIRYAIERKGAEVALLQAEEKYRGIFEHTVEGIFQTSLEGKYLSANPALARIYGYASVDELINSLTDIGRRLYVNPARREEFIRVMEEHDVVTDFESQVYRKDGSIIWISENVRAVRDAAGELLYYEGTVENISERKKTEENLRNSEALYHSLVETIPQNIFRKNLQEQFTFANQRFCQTLGRTLEEIIGKTDFDFFPPEMAAKYQKDDQIIMRSGQTLETVEEHQPPGGDKIYVNVVKTPLYDGNGQIIGLQGIFWDITERKRAEERIQQATLELAWNREELKAKNAEMEEDLRMAREIQQAILPQQYPTFPRGASAAESLLRFSHRYLPTSAVGGDFFNIVALSDTKAGVFICDVMGHGVRSALVTAILRALVEELNPVAYNPGHLLSQLNRDLRAILKQTGSPMFTTAFYALIDLENKVIQYANAGHPKPLFVARRTPEVSFLGNTVGKSSPALGLFEGIAYETVTHPLAPGDLVLLFTDGVYDVDIDPNLLGPDWLKVEISDHLQLKGADLIDQILSDIKTLSKGVPFSDDVCLVGVEVSEDWKG